MTIETSNNPVTAGQEARLPTARTFQMDAASPGGASDTVNLFHGDVLLPLDLVTLEDRGGLGVKVTLTYQSDIHAEVDTWNLEAPTSVVGMGWSLGADRIVLDLEGSRSPYDGTHYLVSSDGSVVRLFLVERAELVWRFEPESYDFSDISYFPAQERWEVRRADGLVRVYGGAPGSLHRAVKWGGPSGNWTDASIRGGQSHFVVAWNLTSTRNRWGDAIGFEYTEFEDDDPEVGAGGLPYTRARYLRRIVMPTGRVATFTYLPKRYDEEVREYERPHQGPPGAPASFQDRFETRYLHAITVEGPEEGGVRVTLFTVRLSYTVENFSAAPGDPRYLYKRYLRAIAIVDADGELLPGARFAYYTNGDTNVDRGAPAPTPRGALKEVTYPRGSRVTYRYAPRDVAGTSLHRSLDRSLTGQGVPRVWFGPNYVGLLRYDPNDRREITLSMLDWNGRWMHTRVLTEDLPLPLDPSTLDGSAFADVLVIWCRLRGGRDGDSVRIWTIRRRFGAFGEWDVTSLEAPSVLSSSVVQVVAGRDFVVAASSDDGKLHRHVWDPRARAWVARHGVVRAQGGVSVAAGASFYVAGEHDAATGMSRLTVNRLDRVTLTWKETLLEHVPVAWSRAEARLSWAVSDSFAAATLTTRVHEQAGTFDYEVRIYGWDRDLAPLAIERAVVERAPRGADGEATSYSFFVGSLVVNGGVILRFNGVAWVREALAPVVSANPPLGAGDDLVAIASGDRCRIHAYDAWSDRILPRGEHVGGGIQLPPSVSDRFVTLWNRIYFRGPSGELEDLDTLPGGARALFNAGPKYLGYVDHAGTSRVMLFKNGEKRATHDLGGHLFSGGASADAGFPLCGPDSFLTWSGRTFETADEFVVHRTLHDRIDGPIPDFVVTSVTHHPGIGPSVSHCYEYVGEGTTGPDGLASQYAIVRSSSGTDDPSTAPWGTTVSYFYDGLRRRGSDSPEGYGVLSGVLYRKDALDADGNTVAVEETDWEVPRAIIPRSGGAPRNLLGYYVRTGQQVSTLFDREGPVPRAIRTVTEVAYEERNGQVRARSFTNMSSKKTSEQVEERFVFAYERYPSLLDENLLNEIVDVTQATDGAVTAKEATIWTQAAPSSCRAGILAPSWHGRARAPDAALGAEEWAGTQPPDPARWRTSWRVDRRDAFGNVLQYLDGIGIPCASLYDRDGRFEIARFSNAQRERGEILFAGFEAYEDLSGWTIGGSAEAFRAAIETGDAQIGSRCVRVPSAPDGGKRLSYTWTMDSRGGVHLFSVWVKTPRGAPATPCAAWTIVVDGAEQARVEFPATEGAWVQIFVTAEIPTGSRGVAIGCDNPTAAWVKVQCVRFAPALGDHRVRAYDSRRLRPRSAVSATGATQRQLFAAFDVPSLAIDPEEVVTYLEASYSSTAHTELRFDDQRPDACWKIRLQGWGQYQNFVCGGDLPIGWDIGGHGRFQIEGEELVHRGAESDVARFTIATVGRYGMRVAPRALGARDLRVAVVVEPGIEIAWDSDRPGWTLRDGDGAPFHADPSWIRGYPWDTCRPALDAATLPAAILDDASRTGLPIGPNARVTVLDMGRRWRIEDPDSRARLELVRRADAPDRIGAATAPRRWIVVTDGPEILLIADGRRVFLHASSVTPTGVFGLRAAADVAFEQIAFFTDALVEIEFQNGDGAAIQRHVLTEEGVTASAVVSDTLGRPAVTTLGARLPSDLAAKFAYAPALASFDWTTLELAGPVAEQNPAAGKYAYHRLRYEASPLGRKVEEGRPGFELAIRPDGGGHTSRITHSVNDGLHGYPAGNYQGTTVTDPDGVRATQLCDRRGLTVAAYTLVDDAPTYELIAYEYDPAGNLARTVLPNGAERTTDHDFLGQPVRERAPSEGETRMIYDAWGRLRFLRDANGAAASPPYFHFRKYDSVGRIVEEGAHAGPWDDALVARADEPAWPLTEPRVVYTYDGISRGSTLGIGQLVVAESRAPGAPPFLVQEAFEYDIWVQTVRKSLRFSAGPEPAWAFDYTYDNLGYVCAMHYPDLRGDGGISLEYLFDRVERVRAVRVGGQIELSYRYDHNGRSSENTATVGDAVVARRVFEHAPVGWPTAIRGAEFEQTIEYTQGRFGDDGGLYAGSPARISVAARPGRDALVSRYGYDRMGRLVAEDRGGNTVRYDYDGTGNLTKMGERTLERPPGTDRLGAAVEGSSRTEFAYDDAGHLASKIEIGARELVLSFDPFLGKASRVAEGPSGSPESVHALRYARKELAYRSAERQGTVAESFLLRGYSDELRAEVASPTGGVTEYLVGPEGVAAYRGPDGGWTVLLRDHVGSVRAAVDGTGGIVGAFDYTPYGELTRDAGGGAPDAVRFRFAGQEIEPFGLYRFAARHYDPRVGAFVSPDPAHQFSSAYTYTGGNPLRLVDPSGEEALTLTTALLTIFAGAAIGGALGATAGAIQGGVTVAAKGLSLETTAAFFGSVALGGLAGAIGGGVAAGAGALAPSGSVASVLITLGASLATESTLGATTSAAYAAMVGEDPLDAAWKGAVSGAVSAAISASSAAIVPVTWLGAHLLKNPDRLTRGQIAKAVIGLHNAHPEAQYRPWVKGAANIMGGTAAGTASAAVSALLDRDSPDQIARAAVAGGAIGLAGSLLTQGKWVGRRVWSNREEIKKGALIVTLVPAFTLAMAWQNPSRKWRALQAGGKLMLSLPLLLLREYYGE